MAKPTRANFLDGVRKWRRGEPIDQEPAPDGILSKNRGSLLACYFVSALFAVTLIIWFVSAPAGFSITVEAVVETPWMDGSGDVADDPAIWVHPTDSSLSVVFGTSKDREQGGLYAYDLDGKILGKYASGKALNNTDLRYGFPLGNDLVDLIGATNRTDNSFVFFRIDARSRHLIEVGSVTVNLQDPYGFCMYKSPVNGSFYAIGTDKDGTVEPVRWRAGVVLCARRGNGRKDLAITGT